MKWGGSRTTSSVTSVYGCDNRVTKPRNDIRYEYICMWVEHCVLSLVGYSATGRAPVQLHSVTDTRRRPSNNNNNTNNNEL